MGLPSYIYKEKFDWKDNYRNFDLNFKIPLETVELYDKPIRIVVKINVCVKVFHSH